MRNANLEDQAMIRYLRDLERGKRHKYEFIVELILIAAIALACFLI